VILVNTTALNSNRSAVAAAVASLRLGLSQGGVISISEADRTGESVATAAHR
jgi:hypothetical protein